MTSLAILAGVLTLVIGSIIAAFVKGEVSGKKNQAHSDQASAIKVAEQGQALAQEQAQSAINMPSPDATQEIMKNDPKSF